MKKYFFSDIGYLIIPSSLRNYFRKSVSDFYFIISILEKKKYIFYTQYHIQIGVGEVREMLKKITEKNIHKKLWMQSFPCIKKKQKFRSGCF
jgi:transcriptional antiterminator